MATISVNIHISDRKDLTGSPSRALINIADRKSPSTKNTDTELCPYYVQDLKIHWDLEEQSEKDINFKKKTVLIPTDPTESVMLRQAIIAEGSSTDKFNSQTL